MTRPADAGHMLLSFIPRAPDRIATPRLQQLLVHQGIELTPRAVQAKLQSLRGSFPIDCLDTTKPYQWQWRKDAPSYEFPPLNAHQALTLKLAYEHIAELLPQSTLAHLKQQLRRADEVLSRASALSTWRKKVRVLPRGVSLQPPSIDHNVLEAVYAALLDNRRLQVAYRRRRETEDDDFNVNPLGLVARGSVLTVVGTIGESDGPRQLHLHRMRSAVVRDERSRPPAGFDLDAYIAAGHLSFRLGAPNVKLRARFAVFSAQTFEETQLARDQVLTPDGEGHVILEATVPDTLELRAWLLGYGPNVEVLGPKEIREPLVDEVRQLGVLYGFLPKPG